MHKIATTQASSNMQRSPDSPLWKFPGILIILVLVIVCVWPAMHALPFSDDMRQMDKAANFSKWTDIFQPDVFNFYRPVKNAIFMAAAPLQKNHLAMHWISLAAYLAATIGIYQIAFVFLKSNRAAWLATCAWALSPSCASTAIWLSCANISIGLVFAACVFHFYERMEGELRVGSMLFCLLFYALSLLCYESMIALPGLLFIRDLHQRRLGLDRKTVIRYGTFTLVALAFLVLRHQFSANNIADNKVLGSFAPDTKSWQLSLSAPWFLWRHFKMWAFPFGNLELLGSYAWMRSASAAALGFGWVFLSSLLVTAAVLWKRLPIISCGLLFFLVASIPAGNFIPAFNGPINDAYLTIPSVGLAIVFASVCETLIAGFLKRQREAHSRSPVVIVILILVLAYRLPVCGAYFRYWAGVWSDPIKLVLLMSESRPFQFQSKSYASSLLFTAGYIEPAATLANEVLKEAPWVELAKLTLARAEAYKKNLTKAEEHYRAFLASDNLTSNNESIVTLEMAEMLSGVNERREDSAILCRDLLMNPKTDSSIHLRSVRLLAQIYLDQGNNVKARATLERGLTIHPKNEDLERMLATIATPSPVPDGR